MTLQSIALSTFYKFVSPGWRASFAAASLGKLVSIVSPRKKVGIENLSRAFPEKDMAWKKDILNKCYHHLAWSLVEYMCLVKAPGQVQSWFVDVKGEEILQSLSRDGKGAIILTGHIGNWELLAGWLASRGYPIHAVVRAPNDRSVASMLADFRETVGLKTFSKHNIMLGAAKMARKGAFIAILADQDGGKEGVHVPFMGEGCSAPVGPAALSHLAGVPIIPLVSYRKKPFHHEIRIYPPLSDPKGEDRAGRLEFMTREANEVLEDMIKKHPEQWLWLHRRWKK